MSGTVLIVDDEANIRELVKFNVEKEGYAVLEAVDGAMALNLARKERPDLIILDLMLTELNGLEVCRALKGAQETSSIPIIMLTAKDDEVDKVLGLELGADDYITKPFSPRELTARIKAVLRRSQKDSATDGQLSLGKLTLNLPNYEAYADKERLELTPKEYELLKLFVTNVGKTFTREQLMEKIWGYDYFGETRTVDVHIRHLRIKLSVLPEIAESLETMRGIGYKLRNP